MSSSKNSVKNPPVLPFATKVTRRTFLGTTAATSVALGLGLAPSSVLGSDSSVEPKKVLILGGTGQTGPHLVRQLLERGHTVTLFNRGNRSDELFPNVECLLGDRDPDVDDGLDALAAEVANGRTWDLCVDIWPHIPKVVENTATLLKDNVGHLLYVSSMSVYTDTETPNGDESTPVGEAPNADEMEFNWELFGPFKAECENRVRRIFGENHTIFRPGLIVGPRDASNRGVYWPARVRDGGEVFAPGNGDDRIQVIDARDLTAFEIKCMENGTKGIFNVTGPHPDTPLTMRGLLEACKKATGSDATFVWANTDFLEEHQVAPWGQMPCWLPGEGEYAGFGTRNVDKALAAGLTFLPLEETILDTLTWYDGLEEDARTRVQGRAGITRDREAELLAAWHEANG